MIADGNNLKRISRSNINGLRERPLNKQSVSDDTDLSAFELASKTTRSFVDVLDSLTTAR